MLSANKLVVFSGFSVNVMISGRWHLPLIIIISLCIFPQNVKPADTVFETHQPQTVSGIVCDTHGFIPGAIVRLQGSPNFTITDTTGSFTLTLEGRDRAATITAWAPGYYIGGGREHTRNGQPITIVLQRHCDTDNITYKWVSAFSEISKERACQNCHAELGNPDSDLPFDQWCEDAHSGSVRNTRFLTMYLGTDIHGNHSPPTRYWNNRDYGTIPAGPNPGRPYYGPGYKLDFPATAGNCAACHAPMAAVNQPYGIDPSLLTGVEAEGIGCDFCHKVWDVTLDLETGLPFDNRPGVLSFALRRPNPGHQLFTGPLDDVAPGEDVFSPIQKESQYCAPCHSAKFWGVEIYNSYGEWLASQYSHPQEKTTCQDCHMPTGLVDHFTRIEAGGKQRDPNTIFSHRMLGATDKELLQNAVTMTASGEVHRDTLTVRVKIINDQTGHHVPTGSPLRQLILVVQATDERGGALRQRGGSKLPGWCGRGDPKEGYVAGLPGTAYAKILEELWTSVFPSGAYWNQTRIRSDNRIAAFESDETRYQFEAPGSGKAIVTVKLLYRREFIELRDMKGWDGEDIEMEQTIITVDRDHYYRTELDTGGENCELETNNAES